MDTNKVEELIRQMLAKAASTTFPAEAESFTIAAEKLILKHKIDRARLIEEEQTCAFKMGWKEPSFAEYKQAWFRDQAARGTAGVVTAMGYQGVWYKSAVAGADRARIYADEDILSTLEDLMVHIVGQCFGAMEVWWSEERNIRGGSANTTAGQRSKAKRDFCIMFFSSVANRIKREIAEESSSGTEIVLSSERYRLYAEEEGGKLRESKTRLADARAVAAGEDAGNEADIRGNRRIA